jgi:glutathione S-transferase
MKLGGPDVKTPVARKLERSDEAGMKLYLLPTSSNSRRAALAAVELNLPVELVLVDLAKGEQKTPAFAAMNPNMKVPVLEDDGFFLNESWAIMTYLADKAGPTSLLPERGKGRAEVLRWMFWGANEWAPAVAKLRYENQLKQAYGLGAPDPVRVAEAEKAVRRLAGILNEHLKGRLYVCGQQLTLADLGLAASLANIVDARLPVTDFGVLMHWVSRIQARPSWQAASAPPSERWPTARPSN